MPSEIPTTAPEILGGDIVNKPQEPEEQPDPELKPKRFKEDEIDKETEDILRKKSKIMPV